MSPCITQYLMCTVKIQTSWIVIMFVTLYWLALALQTEASCIVSDMWCLSWMFMQLLRTIMTNLDERGAAEEETKHVGHNVITDHTGNWHNEPIWTKKSFHQSYLYMRINKNMFYDTRNFESYELDWIIMYTCCIFCTTATNWCLFNDYNVIST